MDSKPAAPLAQSGGRKGAGPVCIDACLCLTERKMVHDWAAVVREGQVRYARDKRIREGPVCFLRGSPDPGPAPATWRDAVRVC